jgi:hypothetical protein
MLRIGFAQAEITPPPGALMAAFPRGPERTPRRALGARDPLFVKAIALSSDQTTVCLCVGDVITWRAADLAHIREAVARRQARLTPERLVFAATHNHASGENSYVFGGSPEDPWVAELKRITVETVLAALESQHPATLAIDQSEAPFNHNRRALGDDGRSRMILEYQPGVTEGPTDPTLTVLRFDRADATTVLWVHWTAHVLTLGPGNDYFSADYPGAMASFVCGERPDTDVLFTNGAAGNIHPRWCMRSDFSALDQVGHALGERVVAAAQRARTVDTPPLSFSTEQVSFTNRVDERLTGVAEISCLRIGPAIIGFLPGDTFVEFQLRFREALSPHPATVVGYANASVGYLPTAEAYPEGGYGVDLFPGDPPALSRTMVPTGTSERLLDTLLALARSIS